MARHSGGFERGGDLRCCVTFEQIEHPHQGPRPAGHRDFAGERFERGATAGDQNETMTMSCEDAGKIGADPAGGASNESLGLRAVNKNAKILMDEVFEELWHVVIEHRAIVAAGFVAERRRQPALPGPGRSPRPIVSSTSNAI